MNSEVNTLGSYWSRLSSRLRYQSMYAAVYEDDVELPDGTIIQYTRIKLPDFVTVVPVLLDEIIMILNYRYPINTWSLELPAGAIEQRENPRETAFRELEEETGYVPGKLVDLGWYYPMPSRGKQRAYIFLADRLKIGEMRRENTEYQETCPMPKDKVYSELLKGEIKHSGTVVALTMASPFFKKMSRGKT